MSTRYFTPCHSLKIEFWKTSEGDLAIELDGDASTVLDCIDVRDIKDFVEFLQEQFPEALR